MNIITPQKAYDILLKTGEIGILKSAIDIGDKYLFVFNSITSKDKDIPLIGPFRTSVDKYTGEIGLFNMLEEKIITQKDVRKDIKTIYDQKI